MDFIDSESPKEDLRLLLEVVSAFNRSTTLEEALEITLRGTTEISGLELCGVYLQDPSEGKLSLVASKGLSEKMERGVREEEKGEDIEAKGTGAMLDTSFVRIPLIGKAGIMGSIHLASLKNRKIGEDKVKLLQAVGMQAGHAIERTRLQDGLEKACMDSLLTNKQLQYIYEACLDMSSLAEKEYILRYVARKTKVFFNADIVKIFIYDTHRNEFKLGAFSGSEKELCFDEGYKDNFGVSGKLLQEGLHSITFSNYLSDDSFQHSPLLDKCASREGVVSGMAAAMVSNGVFLGTLFMANKIPTVFTQEDQKILCFFANLTAMSMENVELFDQAFRAKKEWENTFDSIMDEIFMCDKDFAILRANKAFAQAQGLSPEELIGKKCYQVIKGRSLPCDDCLHMATLKDGIRKVQELYDPEKEANYIVTSNPIFDSKGNVTGFICASKDFTERKKCEQAIQQHKNDLETLHQIGLEIMSFRSTDQILRFILGKARELLDSDLAYLLDYDEAKKVFRVKVYDGIHSEALKSLEFNDDLGVAGGMLEKAEISIIKNYLQDQSFKHSDDLDRAVKDEGIISGIYAPLRIKDKLLGVVVVCHRASKEYTDKDARLLGALATQTGLMLQNISLYEEAKKSYEELKAAQGKIVQAEKLRALGEMASGVAHDFNNFLSILLGNTELLMEVTDDEEMQERLNNIHRAGLDAAETVKRIQSFYQKGGDEAHDQVDLNGMVAEVVEITKPLWKDQCQREGRPIELLFNAGKIDMTLGNAAGLREVITNMIFNAVDAMPHGGTVKIETHKSNNTNIIEVSDNGIGMSQQIKNRIFDPFFSTKEAGSSGLGLSISYGIVARHGGEIKVESEEGAGTTFTISLPIRAPISKKITEQAVKEGPYKARILVIDDDHYILDFLTAALVSRGHEVVTAVSSAEGINKIESERFDIVFTDLGMPGSSGWEVVKTTKKKNKDTFVALITGWADQLSDEEVALHEIDALIPKPMSIHSIRNTVTQFMEQKEIRRKPRI